MRILFANIAWMKFYRGITDEDKPVNGGSFVKENEDAYESTNFMPILVEDAVTGAQEEWLYGFFETKKNPRSDVRNQTHIEKIEGCKAMQKEDSVDGVLVVWCATAPSGITYVVGWYRNATVYRNYETIMLTDEDSEEFEYSFNVSARTRDAVLLPVFDRRVPDWKVPRRQMGAKEKYGFFRANVWYASEPDAQNFVKRLVYRIEDYNGENAMATPV